MLSYSRENCVRFFLDTHVDPLARNIALVSCALTYFNFGILSLFAINSCKKVCKIFGVYFFFHIYYFDCYIKIVCSITSFLVSILMLQFCTFLQNNLQLQQNMFISYSINYSLYICIFCIYT